MKVLIADDSELVRNSLVKLLSSVDSIGDIVEARDVNEAIELVGKTSPDLMIIDIRMPGGSGFDVLEKVRSDRNDAMIIILTNYPNEQFRKKSISMGAQYFFDKTREFDKIIDVCNRYAANPNLVS